MKTMPSHVTNPLAGLRIPSLKDLVSTAVGRLGSGTLNLAHPLMRQRLINSLEQSLNFTFEFEMQLALKSASEKAIEHVFRTMKDADYQEKRRRRLEQSRKGAAERREKREALEREARMDYSRRHLNVEKKVVM